MADRPIDLGDQWRAWCMTRLAEAGYDSDEGAAVKNAVNELAITVQELKLEPETAVRAARLLSEFADGSDVPDDLSLVDDRRFSWIDLVPGMMGKGMTVRVRPDAYTGGGRYRENGLVGKIVAISGGMVGVQYRGAPTGSVARHAVPKLQHQILR
jgi:hypothetical protein